MKKMQDCSRDRSGRNIKGNKFFCLKCSFIEIVGRSNLVHFNFLLRIPLIIESLALPLHSENRVSTTEDHDKFYSKLQNAVSGIVKELMKKV